MSPSHDGAALLALDREHLWHPYTSMTHPTPARLVVGADGTRLRLADGREVVDAMSSWWAAIHGYRHPVLDAALREQAGRFSHVMFGGLTHEPAVRLAERLVALAPDGLRHVFLADSGSVSVEVALKMTLQWQRGRGRPERTRMLTVLGGYHGDTFGCMSVCDPVGGMHSMFSDVLPAQVFAPRPPADEDGVAAWADDVRRLARAHAHELAGIIVEPLLQGAGGMHVLPRRMRPGAARDRRRARPAPRPRRDRHRLRAHRDPLRQPGRRRDARHPVRREGADRGLPEPGRSPVHRRGGRGHRRRRSPAC